MQAAQSLLRSAYLAHSLQLHEQGVQMLGESRHEVRHIFAINEVA
jgi:hypothetical protein